MERDMAVVTEAQLKLLEEVRRDPVAAERLRAKCQWERMTAIQVLIAWGDPRNWK
jgi:hypothetical protein